MKNNLFYRAALYIALAVALTAMLGSLYFSEVRHYLPCNLCWYQRILMYPLVAVIAVGLLRQDISLPYYILPLSLLGQGIATYHYLLEKTNIFAAPTACQEGIPCTTPWINWWGFATIPFLAMCAFFLITVLSLLALTSGEPSGDEGTSTPWLPVGAIIAVVVVAFVLIYQFDPVRQASTATLSLTTIASTGAMTPVDATPITQAENTPETIAVASEFASMVDPPVDPPVDLEILATGQRLYSASCAVCHGPNAQGVTNLGTALVESNIINGLSADEALAFIRTGRAADDPENTTGVAMPPSGGHTYLSDDDILAIIAHLQNLE